MLRSAQQRLNSVARLQVLGLRALLGVRGVGSKRKLKAVILLQGLRSLKCENVWKLRAKKL